MLAFVVLVLGQAAGSPPDDRERWLPAVKVVNLERAERTLGQTLKVVREQTGLDLRVSEMDESAKVTIEWKNRPVLEALHELCRGLGTGSLSVKQGVDGDGTLELNGQGKPSAFACHWKQFRIEFTDAVITTTRSLQSTQRTASLRLLWTAQPGTHPFSVEGFKPEEILDDAGWSLLPKDAELHRYGSGEALKAGEDPGALLAEDRFQDREERNEVHIDIRAPAPEAKTIERLRGELFMTFPMRFVDETIPAAEMAAGKDLKVGPATIHVSKFEQHGDKLTFSYRLSSRGGMRDFSTLSSAFELQDEKGKALNRGYSGGGSEREYTLEYTLLSATPVAKFHYKAFVGRISLAIPVDLRALPLPVKKP